MQDTLSQLVPGFDLNTAAAENCIRLGVTLQRHDDSRCVLCQIQIGRLDFPLWSSSREDDDGVGFYQRISMHELMPEGGQQRFASEENDCANNQCGQRGRYRKPAQPDSQMTHRLEAKTPSDGPMTSSRRASAYSVPVERRCTGNFMRATASGGAVCSARVIAPS